MRGLYAWLRDENNRGILILIGGVIAAFGSAYAYFYNVETENKKPKVEQSSPAPTTPGPTLSRTFTVCRCKPHDYFSGCG
jgi:hypothetical protein